MFVAGIIRPSCNPYSESSIACQEQRWELQTVDYRVLNKIKVANKFPIPAIGELLNELGGAKVFSKLLVTTIQIKLGDEE